MEIFRLQKAKTANDDSCILYAYFIICGCGDTLLAYSSALVVTHLTAMQAHGEPYEKILPYNAYYIFDIQKYYYVAWAYQFASYFYLVYNIIRELPAN